MKESFDLEKEINFERQGKKWNRIEITRYQVKQYYTNDVYRSKNYLPILFI